MSRRNPLALGLVAVLLVVLAAACGGGSTTTGGVAGTQATKTAPSPAAEKARIRTAWTRFFSSKTSAAEKQKLLQNGSAFSSALAAQSKSPLAGKSSATVSKVTLEGPAKAKVVYTIELAGTPALQHQTGTAVKTNGGWKVGDASFCNLLKLGGSAPSACANLG